MTFARPPIVSERPCTRLKQLLIAATVSSRTHIRLFGTLAVHEAAHDEAWHDRDRIPRP